MKAAATAIGAFTQEDITKIEQNGEISIDLEGDVTVIAREEVEISAQDIPGWSVANLDGLTVALDVTLTENLLNEGNAREFINKVQNLRKEKDFNVTDRIRVEVSYNEIFNGALNHFKDYICTEILAEELTVVEKMENGQEMDINNLTLFVSIHKN